MSCPVNPSNFFHGDHPGNFLSDHPRKVTTQGNFMELARQQWDTPEPHFKPGYTGYTPGRTYKTLGMTYGHYTNRLMCDHEVAGGRLSRIPGDYVVPLGQNPTPAARVNPHALLEPHFLPGYTGFTPGSGFKRSEGFGETYGKMTHVLLSRHFLGGGRLRPIDKYPPEYVAEEEDVKFYCYEHEITRDDIKRRVGQLPGYTGYIPRALFRHGKNGTKIAAESIAEFQKLINK